MEQVISTARASRQFFFYRTAAGAEIDLVIVEGGEPPVAVEIKRSLTPAPGKGFWNAYRDLRCRKGYIVYPGADTYPLREGVVVLPLNQIGEI